MANLTPQEMMEAVMMMRKNMEPLCEAVELQAKIMGIAYKSLKDQGFSDSQAVDIIKSRGAMLQ